MEATSTSKPIAFEFYAHFLREGVTYYRFKVQGILLQETFAADRFSHLLELRNTIKKVMKQDQFKALSAFPSKISFKELATKNKAADRQVRIQAFFESLLQNLSPAVFQELRIYLRNLQGLKQ
jgi:hypothetical protein